VFFDPETARDRLCRFYTRYPAVERFIVECRAASEQFDYTGVETQLMALCHEQGLDLYGRDVRMKTFLVVVETKDTKGEVIGVGKLETVVALGQKAAEMAVVAYLAKAGKFVEGMEPTAVPFDSLIPQRCK